MENLHILPTNTTMEVLLTTDGIFTFKGISIPENIKTFINPILEWLKNFKHKLTKTIVVNFEINYFNTVTSRYFYELIVTINQFKDLGSDVTFNWYYEADDDDLKELGEEFEYATSISFNYIEI